MKDRPETTYPDWTPAHARAEIDKLGVKLAGLVSGNPQLVLAVGQLPPCCRHASMLVFAGRLDAESAQAMASVAAKPLTQFQVFAEFVGLYRAGQREAEVKYQGIIRSHLTPRLN